MDITWLGYSSFTVKTKGAMILTDPFDESLGYAVPADLQADVVTVSHDHPRHSYLGKTTNATIIRSPGEYEVGGIFVLALRTFHDAAQGAERGRNLACLAEIDDMRVCHLGDLGHTLTNQQAARLGELGDVEVLLVPVGGGSTIDAKAATECVRLLSPRIVIPMHYRTEATPWLEPVDDFLKEMGQKEIVPQKKLQVTRATLPAETRVVVLEPNS